MPTTTPSGLVFPAGNEPATTASAIEDLANSTQLALNRQANAYRGTRAERQAHTANAKQGDLWSESDYTQQMFQFRNNLWHPEYEFVKLEGPHGGTEILRPTKTTGIHVHSFGRMATLEGTFTNPTVTKQYGIGAQIDLAKVPIKYAPDESIYHMIWARGKNKINSEIRLAVNRHTGQTDGRRVLIRCEETFNVDKVTGSWVTFTVSWAIPQRAFGSA